MTQVLSPFAVTYQGKDADYHILNARPLGESIIGASKLYNAVAHYCAFGFIPKGNYRKEFYCYAKPPSEGSFEWLVLIATISQEYQLHSGIYEPALKFLFSRVLSAIKDIWTRKGETIRVVEALAAVLTEQARINGDIQSQLINAVTKGNDNLASLHERLIDTLPQLADVTRNHGRQFVAPIGNTCSRIKQVPAIGVEVVIDEAEAAVIKGDSEMEVGEMQTFECKITEVNTLTGHCILAVEGFDSPIIGKISDPAISAPNNIYTKSLNAKTSFQISAKPVLRDGVISKLFISDANAKS